MSILKRSNLPDLYLEDALPFLEDVIEEEYMNYPYISEMLFNIREMSNGLAQHTQVSSLSPVGVVGEAEEIPQDRVYQGYATNYRALKYGVLLATSQEAIDDERFDSISKNPKKLGRAVASTREITSAAVFNTGFATNGSDGVPLFSTSHPLLAPGAGTSSNLLAVAADLSITSLKDLVTVMKKQLDTAGNKIMIKPKTLLLPSELEYLGYELLHSTYLPEGSLNNVNSMGPQGIFNIAPQAWEYLTDADGYFLVADKADHDMYWFWAKQPEIQSEVDFKTNVLMTRVLARWAVGYSDWRGVAGCPGA